MVYKRFFALVLVRLQLSALQQHNYIHYLFIGFDALGHFFLNNCLVQTLAISIAQFWSRNCRTPIERTASHSGAMSKPHSKNNCWKMMYLVCIKPKVPPPTQRTCSSQLTSMQRGSQSAQQNPRVTYQRRVNERIAQRMTQLRLANLEMPLQPQIAESSLQSFMNWSLLCLPATALFQIQITYACFLMDKRCCRSAVESKFSVP